MAELKTKVNDASVADFLGAIPDPGIRQDCRAIVEIMQAATKAAPEMWGTNIVGFGRYRYAYANGVEGEWMLTAFAPRKRNITLYIMGGFEEFDALLAKLGPHTSGKGCHHIKRLGDLHLPTLKKLVRASVQHRLKIGSTTAVNPKDSSRKRKARA
jgi:Domain of unknown function (DU1801)